jgi:hypothetical protein
MSVLKCRGSGIIKVLLNLEGNDDFKTEQSIHVDRIIGRHSHNFYHSSDPFSGVRAGAGKCQARQLHE